MKKLITKTNKPMKFTLQFLYFIFISVPVFLIVYSTIMIIYKIKELRKTND